MVFAPVDPAIKEKVISLYLAGHGRNAIFRQLNDQGIKISHGSVSNSINAYRKKHEQPLQSDASVNNTSMGEQPRPSLNDADISTGIPMNIGAGPLLMARHGSGIGQAVITNSNFNVIPRDGGPLFHLLGEDTSTDEEKFIPPVTSYSNLPSSVPPTVSMSLYPNTNIPSNFNPYFNPYHYNINPQISKPETQESLEPKPQPQHQHQQYHDDNNDSNYDDQEVLDPELKKEFDDTWQKNLFQKIIEGRKERQLMERRQQELDEQERQIENIRQDLEAREKKLLSVEDLIPSAKYLKDIGIGFVEALAWIDCIKEVAQKEGVDERTAAWKLADILRSFKTLSDLEKAIAIANQQFALLNIANDQQRNAISTLVNLKNAGFSEKDIRELTAVVNTWNARGSGIASLSHVGNNGGKKLDTQLIGVGH
jgi:hypothetical protein